MNSVLSKVYYIRILNKDVKTSAMKFEKYFGGEIKSKYIKKCIILNIIMLNILMMSVFQKLIYKFNQS